jgi:hypothetical protein
MRSALKKFAYVAASFALCVSPAMAAATTTAGQPVSALTAISIFGTQASAQTVCSATVAAAGAAVAAQGQGGCVLPATDAAAPIGQGVAPPPALPAGNFGINWLLAGLGALALIAGVATLFDDDDDDGVGVPISPV